LFAVVVLAAVGSLLELEELLLRGPLAKVATIATTNTTAKIITTFRSRCGLRSGSI